METSAKKHTISIMAGNPKVEKHKGRSIKLEAQLNAFEEALKIAAQTRESIGKIFIAFDHIGSFKKRFLLKKSNSTPTLADCIPEIADTYRPMCDKYDIPLENIEIITEEYARARMLEVQPTLPSPFDKIAGVMRQPVCEKKCKTGKESEEPEEKLRITCKGITAAIIECLARNGDQLHLFWEYDPVRCKPSTITGGMMLAEKIFPLRGKTLSNTMIFRMPDGTKKVVTTRHVAE